jgi:hypothetical protein
VKRHGPGSEGLLKMHLAGTACLQDNNENTTNDADKSGTGYNMAMRVCMIDTGIVR